MRRRVLLAGKNQVVIDEFFYNMSEFLECQTSSMRSEDVSCHIKYFNPELFVYCLKGEGAEDGSRLSRFFGYLSRKGVPYAILGDEVECNSFTDTVKIPPSLVLTKPLTAATISNSIVTYIQRREELLEKMNQESIQERGEETTHDTAGEESGASGGNLAEDTIGDAVDAPASDVLKLASELIDKVEVEQKPVVESQKEESRKHVTVVDDDPRMLKVIKEYLHDEYDVAVAVSGKIALRFLECKKTDIILLDYVMPGEDGPVIFGKIREIPEYKDTPIVFLTGMSEKDKIQKVMSLHPQGYLLKPVEKERLMSTIKGIIG